MTYPDGSQGILYAAGGVSTESFFLNLRTLTWEPKAEVPFPVANGVSVPFLDSFLIVGGYDYNEHEYLYSILYYNPALDQWDTLDQSTQYAHSKCAAFLVPDSFANCTEYPQDDISK